MIFGLVFQVPAAGAEQQSHKAHEEQCQQKEELGGEGPGLAGVLLPVLQVVVHCISQVVLIGRIAQLTTSLVNLKGMTDGNVPHLQQS